MTAILLAAGVATAATVVFTGVMSVSSQQCCGGRERRRGKLRREPAKTIVSENEVTYVLSSLQHPTLLNIQFSNTYTEIKHMRRQKRQLLKRKRRNEARNEVRNAPRRKLKRKRKRSLRRMRQDVRREQRRSVCRNLRSSKRSKLL